jgi:ribosomal protein S20
MKEGEKHHLERKVAQMEAILILCVSKEVVHKNHARRA